MSEATTFEDAVRLGTPEDFAAIAVSAPAVKAVIALLMRQGHYQLAGNVEFLYLQKRYDQVAIVLEAIVHGPRTLY